MINEASIMIYFAWRKISADNVKLIILNKFKYQDAI